MHQLFHNLTGGEASPYLRHRVDFAKHASSLDRLENFLILPYGGIRKRPGTLHLATLPAAVRLHTFEVTSSLSYVLAFSTTALTIYRTDGTVAATLSFAFGTPADIQLAQVNDVAWIASPAFHPLQLSRLSDSSWTLEFLPFSWPPMLPQNTDAAETLTVLSNPVAAEWLSATAYTAGQTVLSNLAEYVCILTHTSSNSTRPGINSNAWKTYWTRKIHTPGSAITLLATSPGLPAYLSLANTFTIGDLYDLNPAASPPTFGYCEATHQASVNANSLVFQATTATPLSPTRQWTNVRGWNNVDSYLAGILAYKSGNLFRSLADNANKDPDTEPTFWEPMGPLPTSKGTWNPYPSITAGTKAAHNGKVYTCILTHTPTLSPTAGDTAPPTTAPPNATYWTETSRFVSSMASSSTSPGTAWEVTPSRDESEEKIDWQLIESNDGVASPTILLEGAWDFLTFGNWDGNVKIQRSTNVGSTWETVRSYTSDNDRNISTGDTEDSAALFRLLFDWASTPAGTSRRAELVPASRGVAGHVLATTYVSPSSMTGTAKSTMMSGPSAKWSRGAFNGFDGHPVAVSVHERRLVFAGTASRPVSLWFSRTDDLLRFRPGTDADDAMIVTLASTQQDRIRWMASQRRLVVGTTGAEWLFGTDDRDTAITPENALVRQYTRFGSSSIDAVTLADSIFLVERQGRRLRELYFPPDAYAYAAADLTRLAEHITDSGILQIAYQSHREPTIYAVLSNGTLLALSHNRDEEILGWSRLTTSGGSFRSVAVVRQPDSDDIVFVAVQRGATHYLERFASNSQSIQEADTLSHHLDAGFYGTPTTGGTVIPLPAHLDGIPIDIVVDGEIQRHTPTAGAITLPTAATLVSAGLPVTATATPFPFIPTGPNGPTLSLIKNPRVITLDFYASRGGSITYADEAHPVEHTDTGEPMQPPALLRTGFYRITPARRHTDDLSFSFSHADPFPCTLRGIILTLDFLET